MFGELEFWFALIKVVALVSFLLVGIYFVIFGTPVAGQEVGFSLIADNGGMFPNGLLPAIVVMQGVVFAYASIELIGTAAGETENPEKIMPRAINTVIVRIAVFYVGSLVLLSLLLPYSSYKAGESPFVTFFGSIGVDGVDAIMNLVVLTAALSSLNAGLYSTGRIMRSMSVSGSAPKFAARMNKSGVPYGGIALTAGVAVLGVVLNAVVPAEAFEIVLNVASAGHHQHLGHDRPVPDAARPARSPRRTAPARASGCPAPPSRAGSPWPSSWRCWSSWPSTRPSEPGPSPPSRSSSRC